MTALLGKCTSCFAPNSLYYPEHDNYLCPKHASLVTLWGESKEHLLDLIAPTVEAWYAHWLERGLSRRDVEGAFEALEPPLLEIVRGNEGAAKNET